MVRKTIVVPYSLSYSVIIFWLQPGTSDPYVKFKIGNTAVYRSKTIYRDLNPLWDEEFDIFVDDLTTPLNVRVWKTHST